MEITESFKQDIAPFFWVDHDESASVCLEVGTYLQDIFDTRADEGFEGSGYDWGSLAQVFLDEKCPQLKDSVDFDPEGIKQPWLSLSNNLNKLVKIGL